MFEVSNLQTSLVGPLDLTLMAGECAAIMGASGSGKSLFLRSLADLDPNEGEVRLVGVDRNDMPAPQWRQKVALVPAESGWWADGIGEHFSPNDHLRQLLAFIEMPDVLGWQVSRLSTGERHRLAIVRALAQRPLVLMLDEPTAALDEVAAGKIERLMEEHCERGGALLLITHDADQAQRLATRQYFMDAGKLALRKAGRP